MSGYRILVASPLGHVVAQPLRARFGNVTVVVAVDREEFVHSVTGRVRFDVVVADLIWNQPSLEWSFDGLDAIDALAAADRLAPVLIATQGHSMEQDHLEEARQRRDVLGVFAKSDGFEPLMAAIGTVALGERLPATVDFPRRPSLFELFTGQRGHTAARMAGAIASGAASDTRSLADAAKVSPNTASKMSSHYIGPLMVKRGEHDETLPLTQAAAYRWCGLHARYITSWCRRYGHTDVLGRLPG